jgi:hypothetical protein
MNYGPNDGLIYGAMWGFAKDSEGDVWAVSSNGLLRLEGHRWQRIGSSWNYPSANATSVFLDKRGTLWVGSGTLLLSLQRGEKQFRKVADPVNKIFFRSYPPSYLLPAVREAIPRNSPFVWKQFTLVTMEACGCPLSTMASSACLPVALLKPHQNTQQSQCSTSPERTD